MSAHLDVAARGTRSTPAVPLTARLRSAGVWIVAAIVILITVIATLFMTSDREADAPLHYDSTARDGTKAMVETLRDHGVDVTTTEDFDAARKASAQPDSTLLIPVNAEILAEGDRDRLVSELASHDNRLALIDPGYALLSYTERITVDDGTSPLAAPDDVTSPSCQVPAARAAGTVTTGAMQYAEAKPHTPGVHTCYPFTGPGVQSIDDGTVPKDAARGQLITDDGGDFPITVFGNPEWATNQGIDEQGNAALMLSELSRTQHLVVYYPGQTSDDMDEPPSTIDYVPSWFIAGALWLVPCLFILLLILGRRFGPLAVERLPVIVPAVETVHGRAALSARSHDRAGALHTLRTASLLRIAKRLALDSQVGKPEIIARIAHTTGRDPAQVDWVFSSATPTTDTDLTTIVRQLTLIESEIP